MELCRGMDGSLSHGGEGLGHERTLMTANADLSAGLGGTRDEASWAATHSRLVCVLCNRPLVRSSVRVLKCEACDSRLPGLASFPVVGGVLLMMPAPGCVLAEEANHLASYRQRFETWVAREHFELVASSWQKMQQRFRLMLAAELTNLRLLERHWQRVELRVDQELPSVGGLTGTLAAQRIGWPPKALLPYFVEDWAPSSSFERAAARITRSVDEYALDRQVALVMGAGACGMVRALSGTFERSIGVEVCLPTLLVARSLFEGGQVQVALHAQQDTLADYPIVTVPPTPLSIAGVDLVAASILDLPYANDSISLVITQYVLDVVPDCARVAHEANRVLRDGGIWINYGPPFRLPGDPEELGKRPPNEMPEFVRWFGFECLSGELLRHDYLNMTPYSSLAARTEQPISYFVARKTRSLHAGAVTKAFRQWYISHESELWELVPHRRLSSAGAVRMGRLTDGMGMRATSEVAPSAAADGAGSGEKTDPSTVVAALDACLHLMDGVRSAGQVYRELLAGTGAWVREADFVSALRWLWLNSRVDLQAPLGNEVAAHQAPLLDAYP